MKRLNINLIAVILTAYCVQLLASEPKTVINAAGIEVAVAQAYTPSQKEKVAGGEGHCNQKHNAESSLTHADEDLLLRAAAQMDPDGVLAAAMIEETAQQFEREKKVVADNAAKAALQAMAKLHGHEQEFKMITELSQGRTAVAPKEKFTTMCADPEFRPELNEDEEGNEYIAINHPKLRDRVKPEVYMPFTKKSLIKQIAAQLPKELKLIIDEFDEHGDDVDWSKINKRILLSGPSGSGKTSLAAAFAQRCGLDCVVVDCNSVCDEFENSGDIITRVIMDEVTKNNQPMVIVFDEFQEAVKKHFSKSESTGMLSQIYRQMDKLKNKPIIIICIANEVEKLPKQIFTRLKQVIRIDLPNLDQRKEAFQYHIDTRSEDFCSQISVDVLAQNAEGLSLREIETVFENACAEAGHGKEIYRVTMHHLASALDNQKKADSKVAKVEKSRWDILYDKYRKPLALIGGVIGVIAAAYGIYMYIKAPSQQAAQIQAQKDINSATITAQSVENKIRMDHENAAQKERLAYEKGAQEERMKHEKAMQDKNLAQQKQIVDRQNDPRQIAQNVAVQTATEYAVNKTVEYGLWLIIKKVNPFWMS